MIGNLRLDRLEPEHIEAVYRRMADAGARPAIVHQAHRTLRTALGEAERRAHLGRNPATLVRPPRLHSEPIEPFTLEEVHRLLAAAQERRNGARWAIALALGLRQDEALALRWEDVDLEANSLRVRATRLRPVYEHGCDDECGKTPGYCPRRRQINVIVGATKSAAGNRIVGMPAELVALLKDHSRQQLEERIRAGSLWEEGGWVFTTLIGRPIAPNSDYPSGEPSWSPPESATPACTTHATRPRPCSSSLGSLSGRSCRSWAGRARRWRPATSNVTDPIRREVASRVGDLLFGEECHGGKR